LRMDTQAVVTQALRPMTEDQFIQAVNDKVIGGGMLPEVDGPVTDYKCVEVKSTTDEALDAAYAALEGAGYEILLPDIAGPEEG